MKKKSSVTFAKKILKKHFTNKIGNPIKTPYYQNQLEVFYEDQYTAGVIKNALKELVEEKFLIEITKKDIPNSDILVDVNEFKFFINSLAIKNENDKKRILKRCFNIGQYINKYSKSKNRIMLGDHLESLVKYELRANGFKIVGEHTNQYKKNKGKTKDDLDFIAEHKELNISVGVEVKNSLKLIDKSEIDLKIQLCNDLKIISIFAGRGIKPYAEYIQSKGGFPWIFKKQLYPLGQEEFVEELLKKLSFAEKRNSKRHSLQFPIMIGTEIPKSSRNDFTNWLSSVSHER